MNEKKYKKYSEEFKLSVLRDYYASGMYACVKKYGLSTPRLLVCWLRKYDSRPEFVTLSPNQSEGGLARRTTRKRSRSIRELEKALEFSKLETLARDMMIDKAEFDIRKKPGAK